MKEMSSLDVVTIGESMVQMTPMRTGLLRHATHFERFVAGAESNFAIGVARLGHRAGWISRVGQDEFGACVLAAVRGEGVDTSSVVIDEEAPTGVYFKERRRSDLTRVYYYRSTSAASRLAPDDLDADYIGQAKYLHLTGITPALSATCRKTTWEAIRLAEQHDVFVSLDPNVRHKLWPKSEARAVLRDMIPYVHTVLVGSDEATLLTDETHPEAAAHALQAMGPAQVVVRLGKDGALVLAKQGGVVREAAIDVDPVEVVGAGDAFNAGYLSGQLRGWGVARSLRLGNILGGLATTVLGDIEGFPTWSEVQPYLKGELGRQETKR